MEFSLSWRELLVAVVLAMVLYLIEAVLFSRRASRRPAAEADARLAERVRELEQRVAQLEGRGAGDAPEAAEDDDLRVYDDAVRMARQGLPATEIAGQCGISLDEATLVVTIHARAGRPRARAL